MRLQPRTPIGVVPSRAEASPAPLAHPQVSQSRLAGGDPRDPITHRRDPRDPHATRTRPARDPTRDPHATRTRPPHATPRGRPRQHDYRAAVEARL
eukprot:31203-Prymnesium_polylepis.1